MIPLYARILMIMFLTGASLAILHLGGLIPRFLDNLVINVSIFLLAIPAVSFLLIFAFYLLRGY